MTKTRRDDTEPVSLRPDCANCFGLCCVAPAFAVSADFAIDKPPGRPCPHLQHDFRCAIHAGLRQEGFPGCAAYDCFGAGQRVAQETFGGQDWRRKPTTAREMFAAFGVVRQLHELMWLLGEAERMVTDEALSSQLAKAREATDQLACGGARDLVALDIEAHRRDTNQILLQASEAARAARGGLGSDYRGAHLVGGDLRRENLANASLRGAVLVGANLQGLDLGAADLTGADLRGANIRGANLARSLFLAQAQIDSALGSKRTALPAGRTKPAHWV